MLLILATLCATENYLAKLLIINSVRIRVWGRVRVRLRLWAEVKVRFTVLEVGLATSSVKVIEIQLNVKDKVSYRPLKYGVMKTCS